VIHDQGWTYLVHKSSTVNAYAAEGACAGKEAACGTAAGATEGPARSAAGRGSGRAPGSAIGPGTLFMIVQITSSMQSAVDVGASGTPLKSPATLHR
jgi:hypothetical protein